MDDPNNSTGFDYSPKPYAQDFLKGGESAALRPNSAKSNDAMGATRRGETDIRSNAAINFTGSGKPLATGQGSRYGSYKRNAGKDEKTDGQEGFWRNRTGAGKMAGGKRYAKMGGRGMRRAALPAALISLALIFGGGGLILLSQASLPFSLISVVTNDLDFMDTVTNLRSRTTFVQQLRRGMLSEKQKKKLKKQGIEVEDNEDGSSSLVYKDLKGEKKTVTADSFNTDYDNNADFHRIYYEGSKTWNSSSGAWYDSTTDQYLEKNGGLMRNNWYGFKEGDENAEENFRSKLGEQLGDTSVKGKMKSVSEDTEDDGGDGEDGEEGGLKKSEEESDVNLNKNQVEIDADGSVTDDVKLKESLTDTVSNKIGKISQWSGFVCGAFEAATAIGALAAAMESAQVISFVNSIAEVVQRTQMEEGKSAPINELSNALVKSASKTYKYKDANGNDVTETLTGSAMEAEGITSIYAGTAANSSDASVRSFNIWSSSAAVAALLRIGLKTYTTCTTTQLVLSAVGVGADIFAFFTGGASAFIKDTIGGLVQAVPGLLLQGAVSAIVNAFAPQIAAMLARDLVTNIEGEDTGNAIATGLQQYLARNHQASGGAVATTESLASYYMAQDKVIADRARFDRESLSPFDTSSQYTFMGSLMTQLVPMATQMTSITNAVSAIGSTVGGAINTLSPSASAVSASVKAQVAKNNTEQNNPALASIGGVGDAFGNPYIISDLSTAGSDHTPEEVEETVAGLGGGANFKSRKEDGTASINKNSNLGKYILYCTERLSTFGIADENIAADFNQSTGESTVDAALGMVPFIGDGMDVMSSAGKLANLGYITGESCVIDNNARENLSVVSVVMGEEQKSTSWSENKYYQRYIEDQRLAENKGLIKRSSVTAFLEDYYKENPLDNSYEGILARKSGLTKEHVKSTLALIEYYDFLANYNPEGRYPVREQEDLEIKNDKEQETKISLSDFYRPGELAALPRKLMVVYCGRYSQESTA